MGDVTRQLQVLLLVFPDWNEVRVIEKDVCRHQNGVIQKADGDVVPLFHGLFLELNHPLQPVERCHAVQQPAQLTVGGDLTLDEN